MKQVKWLAIATIALTILIVPVAYLAHAQKPVVATYQAPVTVPLNADTIFALINTERIYKGLKPLIRDARLDASAQAKADDMSTNNYFAHINPVTGKNGPSYIFEKSGQLCSYGSENNSMTYPGETGDLNVNTVVSFMGSKPHREAILDSRYTLSGLAVSKDKIVQHFCIAN